VLLDALPEIMFKAVEVLQSRIKALLPRTNSSFEVAQLWRVEGIGLAVFGIVPFVAVNNDSPFPFRNHSPYTILKNGSVVDGSWVWSVQRNTLVLKDGEGNLIRQA
jgi:hypothetical protein